MCISTGTLPSDDANTADILPVPSAVTKTGTIGISGRMCRSLRRLMTSWILFTQDTDSGRIQVVPQDFSMDELLSSVGPEMKEVGQVLHELELGGSELVSINGTPCRGVPLDQVQEWLIYIEGDFTMVFSKPDADEWTKRVVILKPLEARDQVLEGAGISNFWAYLTCTLEPIEPETQNKETPAKNGDDVGSTSSSESSEKFTVGKELCLGPIPPTHPQWMQQTPLDEGDRILDVNNKTFIRQLDPEDAQLTISTLFHCSPAYLSLLVRTPPSKRGPKGAAWRNHLRKGVVAVSGGALFGAGKYFLLNGVSCRSC